MSNLVKDAVYGPVRKCQLAKYFFRVIEDGKTKYMPVMDQEVGRYPPNQIVQKVLTDLSGDELKVPDVDMVNSLIFYILFAQGDFREALLKSKSSVSKDQLEEYVKWTKEFGQDGQSTKS